MNALVPPSSPLPPAAVHDTWVEHPEGRLFARRWDPAVGSAPSPAADAAPIVLFHDSLGCVALWRDFPERLCAATGRPVIAWDRLGFGRSDPRHGSLSTDFVREEAVRHFPALREAMGLSRFVPFGHSVGGGMALHVAAAHPASVEAVVTVAAQAFVEDRTLAGIREATVQFQDPSQMERLVRHHGDKARWVLEAWTGTWLREDFAAWSLDDVLPAITCPVLALHGEHDEYGSPAHLRRIAAGVRGPCRTVLLTDTRHVPHRERPEAVLAELCRFLSVPGGAPRGR